MNNPEFGAAARRSAANFPQLNQRRFTNRRAVQMPAAPLLSIARTTTNAVAVFWPSSSTGWTLQQNTNSVSSVDWSNVTATIQDDGTTKTLIVSPPTGNRFYRLGRQQSDP